ncbi:MAG: BTAD domain-containing putative transcriptional regulator, partial [Bacillota bacterium]|nr:BTAD domain-containing putative transcriptional regulator [Bacillota bacterium]
RSIQSSRAGKVWNLLAYLIYNRRRSVTQEELFQLLWGDEGSDNPQNALKAVIHRMRTTLEQLDEKMGRTLIEFQNGQYCWNSAVPVTVDVDEFESLCCRADDALDDGVRLDALLQAIELYRGGFLPGLSGESWVLPTALFYQNRYLRAVDVALELLEKQQRIEEAVKVCTDALKQDPYSEDLYRHLLRNLVDGGNHQDAITAYETMSEMFFSAFGVMPAEDIRAIYREAASRADVKTAPPEAVYQQLRSLDLPVGSIVCDYDFFRLLYQSHARSLARSGDVVHIGLLSARSKDGSELSRKTMDSAVENLLKQIRQNLRNGDVATRCSVSQVLIMLPMANYENSCKVCERVIRSFRQAYYHSPVEIVYSVQPVEPWLPDRGGPPPGDGRKLSFRHGEEPAPEG